MAWLYVPVLAESNSALSESSPDIEPSVTSRGKPFAPASWRRAWRTGNWITRLSGLTFPPSMRNRGVATWNWYRRGIHVSHSVSLENVPATKTQGICGPASAKSSQSSAPDTSSLKTSPAMSAWVWNKSRQTYKEWVTTFRQESSARHNAALLTSVSGCSFWPTPSACRYGSNRGGGAGRVGQVRYSLDVMARRNLWPTPTVHGNHNRAGLSPNSGNGLATAVKMWPTPTARDADKGSPNQRYSSGGSGLTAAACQSANPSEPIGGQLSPLWVEWLMGFPIGWTDCAPLETLSFQLSQPSLGQPFTER